MVVDMARRKRQSSPTTPEQSSPKLWEALLAEFIGTFFLTFVSAAPIAIAQVGPVTLSNLEQTAPAGMVVAAQIYALGKVSGAHFNPAVTLAFAERGSFPWLKVPAYWITQIVAAIAAGAAVIAMFGPSGHAGANVPHVGIVQSLITEVLFTFLLVMVILSTATQHQIKGTNAALAVGLTIALSGMVGGPVSGASMNPARSLGPAIVGGELSSVWIYILGPVIGSTLAALAVTVLHGKPDGKESREAQGDGDKETR